MRRRTILSMLIVPAMFLAAGPLQAESALAISGTTISTDPYTPPTVGQHATEVEPGSFSNGATTVAAFQIGRIDDGGATAVGWATFTTPPGTNGILPGVTTNENPPGPFDRETDPSVTFDQKHGVWLISSLAMIGATGAAVVVNSSSDGTTWNLPVTITQPGGAASLDKPWINCDDTSTSPFYGNCYETWDDNGAGDVIYMSTSSDGGQTWSAPVNPSGRPTGLGGQPMVQPTGTVIVPGSNAFENGIIAWTSTNGGASWTSSVSVSKVTAHGVAGSLRAPALPSSAVDASGKVYTTWMDCRFETSCKANDIVMSTSTNGTSWTAVSRIPADAVGSGVDHFIPGLGVKAGTKGSTAHVALTYYYYPQTNCSVSTCQLDTGLMISNNGGSTWSQHAMIGGPLTVTWLASTTQGYMVGDYIDTTYASGGITPVYAQAQAPGTLLNEYMVSLQKGSAQSGDVPAERWLGGTLPRATAPALSQPATAN